MKNLKNSWLTNTPIAHRGLWNENIIENSMLAYENAVNQGYPIEIDLYESVDGVLFSFHDKSLFRMTNESGNIFEKTSKELKQLRLKNSEYSIPIFNEILSLCEKKVPLLIELKNQPSKTFVKNVLDTLKKYKGEYAIQSFNPLYIKQVKDYDENIIRGILTAKKVENEKPLTKFVVKNMALNFLCKPDFISREFIGLPLPKFRVKEKPVLAWTVTNKTDYENIKPYIDNIIFEGFIPNK